MEYLVIIGIIAVFGYIVLAMKIHLFPFSKGKVIGVIKGSSTETALAKLGIPMPDLNYNVMTPKGVSIASPVVIPELAITAIDEALDELFVWYRAAYPTWTKALTHAPYAVLFVEPMAINQETEPGSPAIKVQGQQTAGTCIGFPFPMVYIVLPHQQMQGWAYKDYLFQTIFNEGEHFIESQNDKEVFNRFTGFQDVHRHISAPAMARGLYAIPSPSVSMNCGLEKA